MSPRGQYERPNRNQSAHPKRIPVGTKDKLRFEERPGFHRRIVNDVDDRIAMFEDALYRVVTVPTEGAAPVAGEASPIGSVVRKPVGGGIEGVLMEIPNEYWEADQQAKEDRRAMKEQSLLAEAPQHAAGDEIKISRAGGVTIE